jgi:NADH-quinone oxidoreductase subunit J
MDPAVWIFLVIAGVAVLTALGMLFSPTAVYSVLFLILNFSTVALLYFILGAPFIAMAQITIYAGSIMVLFLFVVMMLGTDRISGAARPKWQMGLALGTAVIVLGEAVFMFIRAVNHGESVSSPELITATASAIGMQLFNKYALPFEITSFILLAAVVGVIVLTRGGKTKPASADGEAK